jgi:integrase/recombinase XerC
MSEIPPSYKPVSTRPPTGFHTVLPIILSLEELQVLIAWSPPDPASLDFRDSLIIGLLASTGLRRSEITWLSRTEVRIVDGRPWLYQITGKLNFHRSVPLIPALYRRFLLYWEHCSCSIPDPPAICQTKYPFSSISVETVYLVSKFRTRELLGFPVRPHLIRHSIATAWLQSGVDIKTLQLLLGHRSLSSTSRYLHSSTALMISAVDNIIPYPTQIPLFKRKEEFHA